MNHLNFHAHFADCSSTNTGGEENHSDWADQVLGHWSTHAAVQGCNDESHNVTQAQPSLSLSQSNIATTDGSWPVASTYNDTEQFSNYFFDNARENDTNIVDGQFAPEMPWNQDVIESGMSANYQAQNFTTPTQHPVTSIGSSSQVSDRVECKQQTQQDTSFANSAPAELSLHSDDPNTAIGTALKNGTFKCNNILCANKSFKRPAELRRHYNTIHATQKPEFWCEVMFCNRSAAAGGKPFHRKYRLQAHMRTMHNRVNAGSSDDMTE